MSGGLLNALTQAISPVVRDTLLPQFGNCVVTIAVRSTTRNAANDAVNVWLADVNATSVPGVLSLQSNAYIQRKWGDVKGASAELLLNGPTSVAVHSAVLVISSHIGVIPTNSWLVLDARYSEVSDTWTLLLGPAPEPIVITTPP